MLYKKETKERGKIMRHDARIRAYHILQTLYRNVLSLCIEREKKNKKTSFS